MAKTTMAERMARAQALRCPNCGKRFMSQIQLTHHQEHAARLCSKN